MRFRVRPSPRLVCSDRPEGCVLSCLNTHATKGIPAIRVRGLGMSVQVLAFRARKSHLVPMQRISFLGMELDLASQTAHLTQEHAQSVLNCLKTLSGRTVVPLKLIQRLLGHMSNYYYYFLFVTYTIIQSIINSEMCSLHLTHPSGQPTLRRPGNSWGFGALLKGLTSVVDNSCWSSPKSNTLSIRLRLPPPGMCFSHREDPRRCLIRAVLSFLHQGLEHRLSTHSLFENPTPDCIGLDQEGGGPAGIFGRWIVPWVWAGWLQCNTETLARLCAQGSYHWDPICVFHGILTRAVFPLAGHILPSLMMQTEPSQRLPCAIGPYGVTSHE